ncbi:hypothetical protein [Paraburkholderia sp. J67]|uniref:DUF7716 domain-containing protein n=1 Tax=Paraburkholderia sp. J67 TaxID=2805435 RepID=UPI002ABD3D49|nr:hypothetical protein [Paraburkholderia sp. J67]
MNTLQGLQALITEKQGLPKVGWIFVDKNFDKTSAVALLGAVFHIPENEDDEFYGEDYLASWLEIPTFLAVIELRGKQLKDPNVEDIANAAVYYLENDDFLE